MRAYDDAALRRLMDEQEVIRSFGAEVEVKRSTIDERPGLLDPYLIARNTELRAAPAGGVPRGRMRMLLKAMLRPEHFLVDMRSRAEHLVMNADETATPDLTEREVMVTDEELQLNGSNRRLWRYEPVDAHDGLRPCFLHLHGGGFFAGQPTGRDNVLRYIADRASAVVFDLDYSLSPEVKFPHAVHEVYAAVQHIRDHAEGYGVDPARIIVGGGSAGANLTAAATLLEKQAGTSMIAGQVLMSPALHFAKTAPAGYSWNSDDFQVDPSMRGQVGRIIDPSADRGLRIMFNAYRGQARVDDPLLSPVFAPDFRELPPALVMTCEMDSLRPQGEYYAARLAQAGVPVRTIRYRGMMHASPGEFGHVPQAEAIVLEIARVLQSAD